jgi:ABC-type glycerol-3-phosphate transport system substrate-binding protein
LLLILAACAPAAPATPAEAPEATEEPAEAPTEAATEGTLESPPTVITFLSWAEYDFEQQALQNMVDAYNLANPDSQVELTVIR